METLMELKFERRRLSWSWSWGGATLSGQGATSDRHKNGNGNVDVDEAETPIGSKGFVEPAPQRRLAQANKTCAKRKLIFT